MSHVAFAANLQSPVKHRAWVYSAKYGLPIESISVAKRATHSQSGMHREIGRCA